VNKTSTLERLTGTDKNKNTIVSYMYRLTNITATHNLVITCETSNTLYIKQNGEWITVSHIYKKVDGRWVEQDITYLSDNNLKYLRQGG